VHAAGGYFYCDGANLNAIMGKAKPGALGVDAMHINLHKTFSTPNGGGGPAVILVSSRDGSDFGPLVERSGARGFIPKAELSGAALLALLE
jgi:glycine dehydrogenase subunit 2